MTTIPQSSRREQRQAALVAEAETWLGTPYHHRAALKGAGVDCAHFVLAVYQACGLLPAVAVPEYGEDWQLHTGVEWILPALAIYFRRTAVPMPGDVVGYALGRARVGHVAILADRDATVFHVTRERGVIREESGPTSALGAKLTGYWTTRGMVADLRGAA